MTKTALQNQKKKGAQKKNEGQKKGASPFFFFLKGAQKKKNEGQSPSKTPQKNAPFILYSLVTNDFVYTGHELRALECSRNDFLVLLTKRVLSNCV